MHSFNQLCPPSDGRLKLNQLLVSVRKLVLTRLMEGSPWIFTSKKEKIVHYLFLHLLKGPGTISLFSSMPLVQLGGRRGRAGDGATHRGSTTASAATVPLLASYQAPAPGA